MKEDGGGGRTLVHDGGGGRIMKETLARSSPARQVSGKPSFVRFVALVFCMDSLVFCMGAKSGFVLAGITLESRVFFSSFFAGGAQNEAAFCPHTKY